MDKHLLTEIEIKDFKCFKDFKADGFKRVNLIGGKNNVGKTAFMEACFVNICSEDVSSMFSSIVNINYMREKLELINEEYSIRKLTNFILNTNNYIINSNKNNIGFNLINKDGKLEFEFIINKKKIKVNSNEFSYDTIKFTNFRFIDNFGLTNEDLKEVFIYVQQRDKEEILNNYINEFDENVINFKIIGGDSPQCKVNDREEYQPLSEFGDGLKHYISIICSLYASKDGVLFIDEIDNGIHWTQLDRLWRIILTLSKELNIQVFATTHSKECIESYARVAKKLEDEDVTYIKMSKQKDGSIYAGVREYDILENSISQDHEVR